MSPKVNYYVFHVSHHVQIKEGFSILFYFFKIQLLCSVKRQVNRKLITCNCLFQSQDNRKDSVCESVASTISADHPSEDDLMTSEDEDNGEDNDLSDTDSSPPSPPHPPSCPAPHNTISAIPRGQGGSTGDGSGRTASAAEAAAAAGLLVIASSSSGGSVETHPRDNVSVVKDSGGVLVTDRGVG